MRLLICLVWLLSVVLAQGKPTPRVWIADLAPILAKVPELDTAEAKFAGSTLSELNRLNLFGIQTQMFNPPRAARALALVSVAINDSLELVRQKPGLEPNIVAVAAVQEVLLCLHPTYPVIRDAIRETASDLIAARAAAKKVREASKQAGRALGAQIVLFSRQDGANRQTIPQYLKPAPGVWTPPLGRLPVEPGWGAVVPIGLAKDQLAQAEAPPAWGSAQFEEDRKQFWQEMGSLDPSDRDIAIKWAGDGGTVTPAGLWQEKAIELLQARNYSAEDSVTLLATLNIAMHNSFIACWKAKFTYNIARPAPWVASFDKTWKPFLRTPRFPAYPSGHSSVSGAAAEVLSFYFPDETATFEQMAKEASYSRIVAGIHWFVDGSGGLELGRRIAGQVLGR
jgi:hypothetical protein